MASVFFLNFKLILRLVSAGKTRISHVGFPGVLHSTDFKMSGLDMKIEKPH